jgi:ferredoxin
MTTRQKSGTPALLANVGTCSTAAVGRMKIVVDHDECEANAVCVGILPEVFEVDDDDNLQIHEDYPAGDRLDKVREAVDSCPKRALALREVPSEGGSA